MILRYALFYIKRSRCFKIMLEWWREFIKTNYSELAKKSGNKFNRSNVTYSTIYTINTFRPYHQGRVTQSSDLIQQVSLSIKVKKVGLRFIEYSV